MSHRCPIHAELRCHPITVPPTQSNLKWAVRAGSPRAPPSARPTPRSGNHLLPPTHFRAVTAHKPSHTPGHAGHPRTVTTDHLPRASHLPLRGTAPRALPGFTPHPPQPP